MTLPANMFFTIDGASASGGTAAPLSVESSLFEYMHSCIQTDGGATRSFVTFDLASSLSEGWACFEIDGEAADAGDDFFVLAGATTDLFKLEMENTSLEWGAYYWDGSAWTKIGSTITTALGVAVRIDVRFKIDNSTGEFVVYANGTQVASLTSADTLTTADTTIDSVTIRAAGSALSSETYFAGLTVDSADTRTLFYDEELAISDGGETDFIGGETNIDEYPGDPVTSNVITTTAASQNQTFNFASHNAGVAGFDVEGVVLLGVAKAVADPSLFLRGISRKSSTNYDGDTTLQPTAADWEVLRWEYENDPSTAAAWADQAAVEASEFGLTSRATA